MDISVSWIKEFVDLPDLPDAKIAEKVTLSVCEVEGFSRWGSMLEEVTVAKILQTRPHPQADKLSLALCDTGTEKQEVVCGAPNCRPGILVPYAKVGTAFPGGLVLEPKEIRGVVSQGMLCSQEELGLGEESQGLMELPLQAVPGEKISRVLNSAPDLVLDVDNKSLTHRPDLWGHFGMAREMAVLFETPLKDPFNEAWSARLKSSLTQAPPPVVLEVSSDSSNLGFLGLSVDGVKIAPSPPWMQQRLLAAGMRPINNIVDISNYVMLELGIPNHIFDRRKIEGGRIVVRRAGKDKTFQTLDEVNRDLDPRDTLVCDAQKPLALAGIMGGLESAVGPETTQIMIEVANWRDKDVRKTSSRLGLRTDSSQRYEKALDSQLLERSLLRILELVQELHPQARPAGDVQRANIPSCQPLTITTTPRRLGQVLGIELSLSRVQKILSSLGFGIKTGKEEKLTITVPSWRSTKDIEYEADIVEEIGRIEGYHNIPPQSPATAIAAVRLSPLKKTRRLLGDYLVLRGQALEIMTYPLVGEALLKRAEWPQDNRELVLLNPLTPEHDRMRPSLAPSLLQAAALNARDNPQFRLFEMGRSYQPGKGGEKEPFSRDLHQAGILFRDTKANPFLSLANVVQGMMRFAGGEAQLVPADPGKPHPLVPASWTGSHPHEFLDVQVEGVSRGIVLTVHPQVARAFKITGGIALALIDLGETPPSGNQVLYQPLPRFPGSDFDLTLVAGPGTYAAHVAEVVKNLSIPQIVSVKVLDIFDLEEGSRAVTLRIVFRDQHKTLSGEFLKEAEQKVMAALDSAGYPLRE